MYERIPLLHHLRMVQANVTSKACFFYWLLLKVNVGYGGPDLKPPAWAKITMLVGAMLVGQCWLGNVG